MVTTPSPAAEPHAATAATASTEGSAGRVGMDGVDPADWSNWRWQHRAAATSLADITALFGDRFDLTALDTEGIAAAIAAYGMRATPYYLSLAAAADPADPVWALAVPSPAELTVLPVERADPIGDELPHLRPTSVLTRRYRDRVLLFPTPTCSVHCRHCFRKRLVGRPEFAPRTEDIDAALDWIASEPQIHEVILTGGDPLTMSDERLGNLLDRLGAIDHVWSLRIHTRMPVVNPFRITPALGRSLGGRDRPVVLVTHFNHAVEVSAEARRAVAILREHGVTVLNQAVLLAGINDTPASHRALTWALLGARVQPYALHHADLVPGTSHLRTSVETGRSLLAALRGTVPGYALPRYLLDLPGGHGKVPLEPGWTEDPEGDGGMQVTAPDGTQQTYPPDPPRPPSGDAP